MKILNIITLLIALEICSLRIIRTSGRLHAKHGLHKSRKSRKLLDAMQLGHLTDRFNDNIDEISKAYEKIEGKPLGSDDKSKPRNPKNPDSDEFIKNLQIIDADIKFSNTLMNRYINRYILTPRVVKAYDSYLAAHKKQRNHDQNDILVYIAKYVKQVKMHKKEDSFFTAINRFDELIKHQLEHIANSSNKEVILKRIMLKLTNANRLISFIKKYMFFVTHLNTDYHFVDRDFAKYGEREDDTADRHKITHKGFKKNNGHVPFTIVISKEDLQHIQQSSTYNSSEQSTGNKTKDMIDNTSVETHTDEKQHYIDQQLKRSEELGNVLNGSIKNNSSIFKDDASHDENEIKLLAREKEENGINADANHTLGFVEPKAKPVNSLNESNFSTLDVENSNRVNELLDIQNDDSELNNLNNIEHANSKAQLPINIHNDVYKSTIDNSESPTTSQHNNMPIKQEDKYLNSLLGLNHESDDLHVNSQASNKEPTNFELIRQPSIEKVYDHKYITTVTPDDNRYTRLSKKAEFDETPIGKETGDIVNSYNKMTESNSHDVGQYLQKQDPKIKNYFQPVVTNAFHDLNRPIIEPSPGTMRNRFYDTQSTPTYDVNYKIGQSLNLAPSIDLRNQGPTMTSTVQDRHLFSASNKYWNKKAESAFKNLLSGKFRL